MGIPRRSNLQTLTTIEIEAHELVQSIEREGAHPLLTEALNAVQTAREKLADWIDAGKPGAASQA